MGDYITIDSVSIGEYTEKHSRFIATLYPCKSEGEATEILNAHKKKYFDARHNVYCYILRDNSSRFSDDGEPHGTAAKPILDVLKGSEIVDCLLVVTRYFGGILLGTGGLVRAYSTATKEALKNSRRVQMKECDCYNLKIPYSEQGKIQKLLEDVGATISDTVFAEDVTFNFVIETEKSEDFSKKLREISSAKLKEEFLGKKIMPIKV